MKKLIAIGVFVAGCFFAVRASAQAGQCANLIAPMCKDSQTISTSGSSIKILGNGGLSAVFEEVISGSPSTVSIVIAGCGDSGTCTTLDTYTTVANAIRSPSITTPYAYYTVTAAWTGGTSPTVIVNTRETTAAIEGGSGTFNTLTGDVSSTSTGGATTVTGTNGLALPYGAPTLATNSSGQIINTYGAVSVIGQGAVCNVTPGGGSTSGATDDSTPIQTSMNTATGNGSHPGTMILPSGKWCGAKGLVIPSGLAVVCSGQSSCGIELMDNANETLMAGAALGYPGVAAANLDSSTGISASTSGTCILTFANGATGTVNSVAGTIAQQGVVMTSQGSSTTTNYMTAAISDGTATGCGGTAALSTRVHEVTDVAPTVGTGSSTGTNQVSLNNVILWCNQENQSGPGPYYCVQIYGYANNFSNSFFGDAKGDCVVSDFGGNVNFYSIPISDTLDSYRNSVFYHCGRYFSGSSPVVASAGAVGLRHIGPSDSDITDDDFVQNAAEEFYIGVNAGGTRFGGNVHPYGSPSFMPVALIESGTVSGHIYADGNPIALVGVTDVKLDVDAQGHSESGLGHAVVGVQLGQAAGGQAFPGSVNQLIPGNLSPGATDSLAAAALRVTINCGTTIDLLGGAVDYVSGEEFNNTVNCPAVDNTAYPSGVYVTGSPSSSDNWDIYGKGVTCANNTLPTCGGSGRSAGLINFGNAGAIKLSSILTDTPCSAAGSAANPSIAQCNSAPTGSFSCATNASAGTCTFETTLVTAISSILVQPDSSATISGVTCNTTADTGLTAPRIAARSVGVSATINLGAFSGNPECFDYWLVN